MKIYIALNPSTHKAYYPVYYRVGIYSFEYEYIYSNA
jgi:hypothetical protein